VLSSLASAQFYTKSKSVLRCVATYFALVSLLWGNGVMLWWGVGRGGIAPLLPQSISFVGFLLSSALFVGFRSF